MRKFGKRTIKLVDETYTLLDQLCYRLNRDKEKEEVANKVLSRALRNILNEIDNGMNKDHVISLPELRKKREREEEEKGRLRGLGIDPESGLSGDGAPPFVRFAPV